MILAYETSTQVCSVSFMDENGKVSEKRVTGRSVHSDHVFLFTQEFMRERSFYISDLDAVLVSNGPGSYTGLRIAASALKGLLFQQDVQLYAANTLASFAMGAGDNHSGTIHSIIDARRSHVYHQAFSLDNRLNPTSKAEVMEISAFNDVVKPGDAIVGTGLERLGTKIQQGLMLLDDTHITASSLIRLYQLPNFKEFCARTKVQELNPDYITSSQINNTDTKGE